MPNWEVAPDWCRVDINQYAKIRIIRKGRNMDKLIVIMSTAGSLAAASIPLAIAIAFSVPPDVAITWAACLGMVGSRAGADIGDTAADT
jgi:hypothetical protein